MALANVACVLASLEPCGRVLMIDWDLEAPGLHSYFRNHFNKGYGSNSDREIDAHPGLIDLFLELKTAVSGLSDRDSQQSEELAGELLGSIQLERFVMQSDIPSLHMIKAGRFDDGYASRVNTFQWEALYNRSPLLFRAFSEAIAQRYRHVLVDSRTGLTDISGICTMLLPERLVLVFTPNRQSLTGILDLIGRATDYRRRSDDLRPLIVFPLASRIEPTENTLRRYWRYGSVERGIRGYQPEFEEALRRVYDLSECSLEAYFDEILIQHLPAYAYGEEISVLARDGGDSLALARRYETFARTVVELAGPWELKREEETESGVLSSTEKISLSDICPYPGLRPFSEADSPLFFGRDRAVDRLLQSLRRDPEFLLILGASGSGKTSLVHAGLLRRLQQGALHGSERWKVLTSRLYPDFLEQLENQDLTGASSDLVGAARTWLSRYGEYSRLVLIIDQFEELFAIHSESTREKIVLQIRETLNANLPVSVILVMRDEFYGRFVRQAGALLEWLERGLSNVPPNLRDDELKAIIEEPARAKGLVCAPGLVEKIIDDTIKGSSVEGKHSVPSTVLPLLQFTLMQLWEHRREGWLTHEAYLSLGGLSGGLLRWAEQEFLSLGLNEQRLARRILTKLVRVNIEDVGLRYIQNRLSMADLCANEDERRVTAQLINARLLVTTGGAYQEEVEVALIHEALIYNWKRLLDWLEEDLQFLLWRGRLRNNLAEWERTGRDEGTLLRGMPLAEAESYLFHREDDLTSNEMSFIRASLQLLEWEQSIVQEREALQKNEANRRLRLKKRVISVLASILIIAVVLALVSFYQYKRAEIEKALAESRLALAQSARSASYAQALAAQAEYVISKEPQVGLLLAVEALRRHETAETKQAVLNGLSELPSLARSGNASVLQGIEASSVLITFSPDGRLLAVGSDNGTISIWDADRAVKLTDLHQKNPVTIVQFSPVGTLLAATDSRNVEVWDLLSIKLLADIEHETPVSAAAFTSDGRFLISGTDSGMVSVWDLSENARMVTSFKAALNRKGLHFDSVAISPDAQLIATMEAADGVVELWKVATGLFVASLDHKEPLTDIIFSPDGRYVATVSNNEAVWLWEAISGQAVSRMVHGGGITGLTFSRDGSLLATAGLDGTARIWALPGGAEEASLKVGGAVRAVAFSPDGRFLATGTDSGDAMVWGTSDSSAPLELPHEVMVSSIVFSPEGRKLATIGGGTARLWQVAESSQISRLEGEGYVTAIAYSPDGKYLATASADGSIRLWNPQTRLPAFRPIWRGDDAGINSLAFSPDGKSIFSAGSNGTVEMWDISNVEMAVVAGEPLMVSQTTVTAIAVSPDGKTLASANTDGNIVLFDLATRTPLGTPLNHERGVNSMAFSPDGRLLASATDDGTIRLWNVGAVHQLQITFTAHVRTALSVAYSPDGKLLASSSEDGSVRLWDLEREDQIRVIYQRGSVGAVAFSPDGRFIATGSSNRSARVWELATGK